MGGIFIPTIAKNNSFGLTYSNYTAEAKSQAQKTHLMMFLEQNHNR